MASNILKLCSNHGSLFEGDYSDNGEVKQVWRYKGKKISAAYVSENNLQKLREIYMKLNETDKSSKRYKSKLSKIVDLARDENYQGEKGFLLELRFREGFYDLVYHSVHHLVHHPKNLDKEEISLDEIIEDEIKLDKD